MKKNNEFENLENRVDGVNNFKITEDEKMSESKDADIVEGFGYCASQQSKCFSDCIGSTPALSNLR